MRRRAGWILFPLLTMLGCASGTTTPETVGSTPSLRFLALGDSYTIGEGVPEADRWPNQLAEALWRTGSPVEKPTIIARTGWTTDELSKAIDEADPQGSWDLVSLLIGVNNQYRGRDAEEYRQQFVSLLNRAITFAGNKPSKVVVVSIPDWGVTPFAEGRDRADTARKIDLFNVINREESQKAGVIYVDITPVSRQADPALIAGDGLHPSGKQYTEWVRLIVTRLRP